MFSRHFILLEALSDRSSSLSTPPESDEDEEEEAAEAEKPVESKVREKGKTVGATYRARRVLPEDRLVEILDPE